MTGKSMDNFVTKDPVSNIPRMFVLPDPPKCDKKDRNRCNLGKCHFNLIYGACIAMILLFGAYVSVNGNHTRYGLREQPIKVMITVSNGSSLLENHWLDKNSSGNFSYLLLMELSGVSVAVEDGTLIIVLRILFAMQLVNLPVMIFAIHGLSRHVEKEQKKRVATELTYMHSEANSPGPVYVTSGPVYSRQRLPIK